MRGRLTKRAVDALKPNPTADVLLWDTRTRGFGVRVKPSGATSFVVAYYAPGLHRVRRRITLGAYPTLTVDGARTKAVALLARVLNGEDPAKERTEAKRAAERETVETLFAEYLDDGRARFKLRTVEAFESVSRLYILPALGRLPVAKVTVRDVAQLHHDLRDKPHQANRVVEVIRAFYFWLARRGLFAGPNPARHIERYPENPRERFLSVEELARIGQAMRVAETLGLPSAPEHRPRRTAPKRERNPGMFAERLEPANPIAVAALRFLLFTGWREQEALTLRWADVDLGRGFATLGDTKSGKSVRALGAPAVELLAAQPRVKGSPYVFPGRDPMKPLEGVRRLWHAVRFEAGLEGVRLHDLRHSVASFAGGRGYSLFLIGKLLGHKTARSTERYAHLADDARKLMADDVGTLIQEALSGDPRAAAPVGAVPLRGSQ
jgi:integrase